MYIIDQGKDGFIALEIQRTTGCFLQLSFFLLPFMYPSVDFIRKGSPSFTGNDGVRGWSKLYTCKKPSDEAGQWVRIKRSHFMYRY